MAEASEIVSGRMFTHYDSSCPPSKRGINATEGKTKTTFDRVLGFFGHSRNIYIEEGGSTITVNRASAKKFISRHLDTFQAQVGNTDVNSITDEQIIQCIQHLRRPESTQPRPIQATGRNPTEVVEEGPESGHATPSETKVEKKKREKTVEYPSAETIFQTINHLGIREEVIALGEKQGEIQTRARFEEKIQALYRLLPPGSSIKLQDLLRVDFKALQQLENALYDQFDSEGANERGLAVLRLVCKGDEAAVATEREKLEGKAPHEKKRIVLEFGQRFSQFVTSQWNDYWTNASPKEKPFGFSSEIAQQQVLQGINNDCFKKFRDFYLKRPSN